MEYFRTKINGTRVYVAKAKRFPSRPDDDPGEMVYRVKDGHALWGYTRDDLIAEDVWLANRQKSKAKHRG